MTVAGKPARRRARHEYRPDRGLPSWPPGQGEEQLCTVAYLCVICCGPVVPLYVYLTRRHTSRFARWHAAQALNTALTGLLYGLSAGIVFGLLTLDKLSTALITVLPVVVIGWAIAVTQLTRAAFAASRGEYRQIPSWLCSPLVKPSQ